MNCKLLRGRAGAIASLLVAGGHLGAAEAADWGVNLAPQDGALTLSWPDAGADQAYTVQVLPAVGNIWIAPRSSRPWPITDTSWAAGPAAGPANFFRVLAVPRAERGRVLAATALPTLSKVELAFIFAFAGVPLTPQFDVAVQRLQYETIGPWGARTVASGLLLRPLGATAPLPLVVYQHGTLARKADAPSAQASQERYIGAAYAATGYAAVLPDYLGLGDSPGLHPYHHAVTEATAGVDLLRAARAYCGGQGIALNGQLFVTGYSQGGHAAAALQRELEEFHADEFPVTAAAPMAGAYDLSGTTAEEMLSGRPQPNPYYLAYLLAAYQEVYRLAPSFADLLRAPYHLTLPPLLDGQHSGGEINAAMPQPPAPPTDILKPEYLAAFRADPEHPLRRALRDNDLLAWTPRAPIRLYHCSGDRDVPPQNSAVAHARFLSRGANATLLDPLPGGDHGNCVLPAMLAAKAWFDSLKQ
jgi:dienelactone hydrolase